MFEFVRVSPLRWTVPALIGLSLAGCGTGDGPVSSLAACNTVSDISFVQSKYLPAMQKAELTVADSCRDLESIQVLVGDGTETIQANFQLDALGQATADINFGATSSANSTISVVPGDTLTATITDSAGFTKQATTEITDTLAIGVYTETNTLLTLPVAEIVTRIAGGKETTADDRSQGAPLYDGVHILEVDYDTSKPGGNTNGIQIDFGPTRSLNSGFELPDATTTDPAVCSAIWTCDNPTTLPVVVNSANINEPRPVARSGLQSMKMFGFDSIISQRINVSAGDIVKASGYALNWASDELNNAVLFRVSVYDANNNSLSSNEFWIDAQGNRGDPLPAQDGDSPDDWTYYETVASAPVGAATAEIFILHQLVGNGAPGSGSLFWDEVKVEVEPGAVGEEIAAFDELRFAIEDASLSTISDLRVQIQDFSGSTADVFLSNYTAVASTDVAGWSTYALPLSDFSGIDLNAVTSLSFLDASSSIGSPAVLVDTTLFLDDINFGANSATAPIPAPIKTGILIDSPIEGVTYSSNTQSGVTNAAGEFLYLDGEMVSFSIGGIVLGTAKGGDYVTPVELSGSFDPSSQSAINMLRFLQSIDADQDHSNGIQISAATQAAAVSETLNFDLDSSAFAVAATSVINAITEPDQPLISEMAALDNFYDTYTSLDGTQTFLWLFPGRTQVGEAGYDLIWSDEFNEGTAPSGYWNRELGTGDNGWGNQEWQVYTDDPQNLSVSNGNLVINALCDDPPNCGYQDGSITSARITTQDNFSFRYGKVQARIKAPTGNQAWAAFWMLGANFPVVGWPATGEIDILEVFNTFGSDPNTANFAMHWCSLPTGTTNCFNDGGSRVLVSDDERLEDPLSEDFHLFETIWTEDTVIGLVDGIEYFTQTIDPVLMDEFRREFFLLLNVAIGGTLGGAPDAVDNVWPQTMLVDYVRVYQLSGGGGGSTNTINPPSTSVSGADTTIDASTTSETAGTDVTITVQAKDDNGNSFTSSAGTVVLSVDGSASLGTVMDNMDGTYTATLSNQVAETVSVTGTIAGQLIADSVDVSFVPGVVSGAAMGSSITAIPASVSIFGGVSTVTVQAADQFGNVIDSNVGTVMLTSDSGGSAVIGTVSYDGGGSYSTTVTNPSPETIQVSGSIDTGSGVINLTDTATIDFTGAPISGSNTTLMAAANMIDAGMDIEITVQARDTNNMAVTNCLSEVVLNLSSTSGMATGGGVVSTCSNGSYTANVSNQVAEVVTVTGTIAGLDINGGVGVDLTFEPGPVDGGQVTISANPTEAASNGIDASTITVQAFDQYGNAISDDVGTLTLTATPATTAMFGTVSFSAGEYTASLTNSVSEMVSVGGSFDTSTGVENIGVVAITATTDVTFNPPQGLFSDTNSDTALAYKQIVDTAPGCNPTPVTTDMVTVFEGANSLMVDFDTAPNACNGFFFDFDFSGSFDYSQDFEALDASSGGVLGAFGEGFQVFADVWNGAVGVGVFQYDYGPFTAPNGGAGFSAIADDGEGEVEQGLQYLNVYSDYNNADHTTGGSCGAQSCTINTSVFKEFTIGTADIGGKWRLTGDYKSPFQCGIAQEPNCGSDGMPGTGDDFAPNTAEANIFIVTLDPGNSFARTNNIRFDTTAASNDTWAPFSVEIDLTDPLLDGQIVQFGFNTIATNYNDSGVYYDNLVFEAVPPDQSGFSRMNFAINVAPATLVDLEIRFQDADGNTGSLYLAADATVVVPTDGNNWTVYQLDLGDAGLTAGGLDLSKLVSIGFFDASSTDTVGGTVTPTLVDTNIYFDDIHFIE